MVITILTRNIILMKSTTNPILFFTLIFLSFLLNELFQEILHFDKLIYSSLSDQLTSLQVENFLGFRKKWQWITYIIIPVLYLLKIYIISTIIHIGLLFLNNNLNFKSICNIVIKSEFIFLLVPIFKTIWFCIFQTNYNLSDVQNFYPLSALNITGYQNLEPWLIYPFQVLNLFELFYIIYLSYEIGKLTNTNTDYGLKILLLSYVPALLLWITAVMFFTLNYS